MKNHTTLRLVISHNNGHTQTKPNQSKPNQTKSNQANPVGQVKLGQAAN
jgi:hypothetical protein